jgi:hypothetical protein
MNAAARRDLGDAELCHVDLKAAFTHLPADSRGRDRIRSGAEGATAPETLRQKDREELMNAGKQPRA